MQTPLAVPVDDARERARDVQSGATRAAVLGINDGLVTNVAMVLGVAAAQPDAQFVRLAGMASLVAGAFSMAVGEYVSMAAQVELLQRLLSDYRLALRKKPEKAREDLEELLTRVGVSRATAHNASQQITAVPDHAVTVYARSLGLDPDELGSPMRAALSSLVTFAAGALVPLIPWFFTGGMRAAAVSIALGATASLVVGGVLGWLGGRSIVLSAARQLFILALAAGATWLTGRIFHVTVT